MEHNMVVGIADKEANRVFHDFINNLPIGICVCSISKKDEFLIEVVNRAFYKCFGMKEDVSPSTIIHALDYIDERDQSVLQHQLILLRDIKTPVSLDVRVHCLDGSTKWVNIKAEQTVQFTDHTLVYLTLTDVNDLHVLNEKELQSEKALTVAADNLDLSVWSYVISTGVIERVYSRDHAKTNIQQRTKYIQDLNDNGWIYAHDRDQYTEMISKIQSGVPSVSATIRMLNQTHDKYEWHQIVFSRESTAEGDEPRAIGIANNIELQKEAEVRYERENLLRKELVKDSVAYYRINLTTGMVEEFYSEFYDTTKVQLPVSLNTLIEEGLLDSCYESDRETLKDRLNTKIMLRNYESGKRSETFTYRRYLPNKGLRWLRASIAKLKRVNTDDVVAFYTAMDIDDEMKDQILYRDVLNEEVENLLTLQLNTRKVRVIKENQNLKVNGIPATEIGYFDPDKAFQKTVFSDVVPEDRKGLAEFVDIVTIVQELEKKPVLQHLFTTKDSNGILHHKKSRIFYLDESKQDIIFVRRDITDLFNEQQRASEALHKAMEEAKAANLAKSSFLSRMSHDMRTPLNAVLAYSGATLREGASEQQKDEFLDDIHKSGTYLLGIINDVLDMSKIESNKMVLRLEAYKGEEFVSNIKTVIEPLCQKNGIHFIVDLPKENSIALLLDRVRFNQIFVNILSNSVKFTERGGTIRLKGTANELENHKVEMHFEISDTGCGMSKEFIPHAFDSFSQDYKNTATHNSQGTGLGLSIVKQLVELMGGTIRVESELNVGTTFYLDFELALANAHMNEQVLALPPNCLQGDTILLCEDHPINRKIAIKLLEKEGCVVETAEDGKIGLEMFVQSDVNHYSAILMDIRMPNMNGLEASKAIRALSRKDANTIPIVAMTANAFVDDRRSSIEAGMTAHLSKPIEPQVMYRVLYQLITKKAEKKLPKILLIEPDINKMEFFKDALKVQFSCVCVTSGKAAYEVLETDPYIEGILIDQQLKDVLSREVVHFIRQKPEFEKVKIISYNRTSDILIENQMVGEGVDEFIYDETTKEEILNQMKKLIPSEI